MRRAVELVARSRRPVAQVAKELGIGPESLRQAVRAAEAKFGQQGFLYLPGVLDVFNRQLLGWCMSDRVTAAPVLSALDGLFRRDVDRLVGKGQLTHHAHHGSQYALLAFSQRLADAGIAASMWRGRRSLRQLDDRKLLGDH